MRNKINNTSTCERHLILDTLWFKPGRKELKTSRYNARVVGITQCQFWLPLIWCITVVKAGQQIRESMQCKIF